jgi:SAM-dependent methyltransferase
VAWTEQPQMLFAGWEIHVRAPKLAAQSGLEELGRAERFVEALLPREVVLKVLAAEAGMRFYVRPPAYFVRVEALQTERSLRTDADEYRTVDLERIELGRAEYDVVLCCNVLEHVRRPVAVLPLLRDSLRPGGLIVIMVPNVVSLKSIVTRVTPFALHRWYYHRVARRPDIDPARSVHSFSLRPASLRRHAQKGGWKIEYWRLYEGGMQRTLRHRVGFIGWRWSVIVNLTRVLSLGCVTAEGTGVIAVLSKVASEMVV